MKTKFKSDEIAHVWAHKSAPRGDAPSAMSFNGDAFLSYGTEIARHIVHKGKAAVILNETGYSVTTSKHQGLVRSALPSSTTVFRYSIGRGESLREVTGAQLFAYAIESAADSQAKAEKARKMRDSYEHDAANWLDRAKFISEFFGLKRKVDKQTIARLRKSSAAAQRKAKAVAARRDAKYREEQQENYLAWLNGNNEGPFSASLFPVAFRIESDELVSTLGARVPLAEARRAMRFALARREKGWQRNGEVCPVGNYQLDAIDDTGIVAGCHRISWTEIERLAPMLA